MIKRNEVNIKSGKLLIDGKWVDAIDLSENSMLFGVKERLAIDNIEIAEAKEFVYTFTVDKNHNYYIGKESVLSHNAKPCPIFVKPKVVKSGAGAKGNFTLSGYTFRVDTNKIASDEGGFHIHVYRKGKEIAKINGRGGWQVAHGGKKLPEKPSTVPKIIRDEINDLVRHVRKNL